MFDDREAADIRTLMVKLIGPEYPSDAKAEAAFRRIYDALPPLNPQRTAVADMVAEQKRDVGRTLNTIGRQLRRHDLAPDEQAEFDRMYGTRATTAAKAVFSCHQWSSDRQWDDLSMDDQEGFYEVAGAVLAALDSTHDCDDLPFCDDPACPRAAAEWGDD